MGDDVQNATFKGIIFTEEEKKTAANIVNFLRPFIQQRGKDNKLPKPHILTVAPIAALSNTIATILGFSSLTENYHLYRDKIFVYCTLQPLVYTIPSIISGIFP